MKVLHVLDHSLPHYDGYAFRSAEIVRFQRRAGLETAHVTSPKHAGARALEETADDVAFYRTAPLSGAWELPLVNQYAVVVALRRRLREVVVRERPQLIHCHSPSLNGMAAIAVGAETGLPVVYEVRSFWEDAAVDAGTCREGDLRYRVTRATETWVVRRAQHVVPICRGIADDLQARGLAPTRTTVVANSVDFERFSSAPEYDVGLAARHGLTRGRTLGFAGSFFNFEGLSVLIDAMAPLVARDPAYRLLLVGDGQERAGLEALARQRGVEKSVIFTGRVPHAEIKSWYGIVDVLVYPRVAMRLTELVTPLKPLEAMAYGKVVVASDVGGHRELIQDGETGLLFRAGDPAHLAATVERLLGDPALQATLSARARDHVAARHNWPITIDKYLELYQRLVA